MQIRSSDSKSVISFQVMPEVWHKHVKVAWEYQVTDPHVRVTVIPATCLHIYHTPCYVFPKYCVCTFECCFVEERWWLDLQDTKLNVVQFSSYSRSKTPLVQILGYRLDDRRIGVRFHIEDTVSLLLNPA